MSDVESKLGHSNIDVIPLKRIRKYCVKKTKDITKEENKIQSIFW